jgi:hypothetical protein
MGISKNLETVFVLAKHSGTDDWLIYLYNSFDEALNQRTEWMRQLHANLEAFERGESANMSCIESVLDYDENGKIDHVVNIATHAIPTNIAEYAPFTLNAEDYANCKNFNTIRWGNPATQRIEK